MTLHYDEAALARELAELSIKSRVVFAASVAQRLFPAFERFCERTGRKDYITLAGILERLWRHLLGDEMRPQQLQEDLERCMELIPGEDQDVTPWIDEQAYADDAASATAYSLRALESGRPQEAAWAARRAYDAADHYVSQRMGIDDELELLSNPIVQAELSRQRQDVHELIAAKDESVEVFTRLRDRAITDGRTFFASIS